MARVYAHVGGRKLTKIIALHSDVQDALAHVVEEHATIAAGILAAHEDTGASYVETESGRVDHYVVLSDERGQKAAMSIEYGRNSVRDSEGDEGPSEGVWALHDAFGLPHGEVSA